MAGSWYKVRPEAVHLVEVDQMVFSGEGTVSNPNTLLDVKVGSSVDTFATERLEVESYVVVEKVLYVKPVHRPLLVVWEGAANPLKERDK